MRNTLISTFFYDFLASFNGYRKKRKIGKMKRNSMVQWTSSEQQFCKLDTITFVVLKIWNHIPSASGSYGRQAVRQNKGRFEKF